MNKQSGKNSIGWCDYTWSPITGCTHGCPYCYARKIALRFHGHFNVTFHPERIEEPLKLKKPSKIFVCSMADIFDKYVIREWIRLITETMIKASWHTYYLLTKHPEFYKHLPFPNNCWLGATATRQYTLSEALRHLHPQRLSSPANKVYVSCEPMLEPIRLAQKIDWLIIGAQTNPEIQPKKEWVETLINDAKQLGVPVFLKRNLKYENND